MIYAAVSETRVSESGSDYTVVVSVPVVRLDTLEKWARGHPNGTIHQFLSYVQPEED